MKPQEYTVKDRWPMSDEPCRLPPTLMGYPVTDRKTIRDCQMRFWKNMPFFGAPFVPPREV